ncbi:MAG: PAS domain S-box protein, partial [Euryarchaeota archaeon]|nr:PAS domain S-box protein [Euryarchaeota archaeon]
YIGATLYGYIQMQDLRVHSQQVIPLSSQISELQEIGISLESLEKNVDKFFTVAYSENLEKANKDIDDLQGIIRSLENNSDNNSRARFKEMEGIFCEIREDINYLANLQQNSMNAKEINEKRILVYGLINNANKKHRELLSETTHQLNANVLDQERIILAFNTQLLGLGFVILILGTVMSIIISSSISHPIKKLRTVTREIAHGNLNVKTGIQSNDEIGQLASAFDKMTEELQKTTISKRTLQTMLDSMPYGIIMIGMDDKKILKANLAALGMMGYGYEEEIAGLICNKVLCPAEDGKCPIIDLKQKVDKSEKILITKDGRRIPILKSVVCVNLAGREVLLEAFLDISERKQAEEALRQSEEKHRMLIENIQDGVFIIQDGVLQFVNEAFARMVGYTVEELTGREFREFIAPEDMEMVLDRYHRRLAGENVAREYEFRVLYRDGITRIIVNMNVGLIDYRGMVASMGTIKDITELKRADEIRIENQNLAYASRAKSEFLANMSHELRTPLNSILGFSELIKMNSSLDEKSLHHLDNVITSGKFLLNLINDILDLSKVESGKMELVIEKINVPSLIDGTLILIKEKASKQKIQLKNELDPSLLFMEADNQRFKQIMFNLLSNAVKFSKPEGGTITITAKKEGDMAKFSVSDTGIGIREEDMKKLFTEFEQLDSGITKKYGGSGLGLAITKRLVELHGGSLTAESKYGEGSTFTVTLPIIANKETRI